MPNRDRDKRRDYHTPATGVPKLVDPRDELSVPNLVDDPAMSRTKSDSMPPAMTPQEAVRFLTLRLKQLERDQRGTAAKVDATGERIRELQDSRVEHSVHITRLIDSLGEFETIAEFRETVVTRLADATGKDGKNGALGALKARFDQSESRKFTFVMFALGLMVTAGSVVFWAGSTVSGLRSDVQHLKEDNTDLREHVDRNTREIHRVDPSATLPSGEPTK